MSRYRHLHVGMGMVFYTRVLFDLEDHSFVFLCLQTSDTDGMFYMNSPQTPS